MTWTPFARTRGGRFALDTFEAARAVVHGFRGEYINLRAGNLTFISIFSLVPLLTVALALLQLLHQKSFQGRLTHFIQDLLAPGIQAESAAFLQKFINSASSKAAGGVSFLLLMLSAGTLLRHLDASLNEIWAVRKARPLLVSFALYALVLLFGPVLLGVSLSGTAGIRNLLLYLQLPFSKQALAAGSAAVSVLVFTLTYKFAPHAPVRLRSALAGGIVGGLGWEVAKHSYAEIARLGFNINPVYGSLSAVPLFLMWIYVSWWLVLFGARLAYAVEHASFRGEFMDLLSHPRAKEIVAARIAQLTAAAYSSGAEAPGSAEIARRLRAPEQMVREIIGLLEKAGLLLVERRGGLRPAKNPSELTLADVSAAVGGVAKLLRKGATEPKSPEFQEVERLFSAVDDASVERLSRVSWASLVPVAEEKPALAPASQNP
ncbi:MAG: YhjD/YihY/BrkB family envelope integrity protein [Myxococcaceae bacterium]